eukprot:4033405-Prymnesium_polylepis.1
MQLLRGRAGDGAHDGLEDAARRRRVLRRLLQASAVLRPFHLPLDAFPHRVGALAWVGLARRVDTHRVAHCARDLAERG